MDLDFQEASDTINFFFFNFSNRISEYLTHNNVFAIVWQEKNFKIFPCWKIF